MTKISLYPILSNPTEDDILIGTDANNSDETRNFSIGSIVNLVENGGRPYNVYTALLTQTGTNDPVATVLENTIGDIVWSRDSIGYYAGTLTGGFPLDKTFVMLQSSAWGSDYNTSLVDITDVDTVNIQIYDYQSETRFDGALNYTSIEIRVYN